MVSPIDYVPPEHLTLHTEYPYTEAMNGDLRGWGYPAVLCPHVLNNSASRLGMLAKHWQQTPPIVGSEFINTFGGYEQQLKETTFDESRRSDSGQILAVIPKYDLAYKHTKSPYFTVIYKRESDGVIDMFAIDRYTKLSDGWGYKNEWNPKLNDYVSEGSYLDKDIVLSHTPNIKDGLYSVGVNANVVYITAPFDKEDSVGVSESLAKKLGSWFIMDVVANIRPDYVPINLYGTEDEPKFFPNIGEKIRNDGIICAFRPVNVATFAGDSAPEALKEVDPLADIIFVGPQNGTIVDVDFIVNRQKRQQAYPQIRMYQEALIKYYKEILKVYDTWNHTHQFSPVLKGLVKDSIIMLSGLGIDVPGIKLTASAPVKDGNKQVVDFIQATFRCVADAPFRRGSKLSDLQGSKGTCAVIIPDEDMPVDIYGNRADLIMEANTTVKRTNYGAFYEPSENFILKFVWTKVKGLYEEGKIDEAFNDIVDITRDFHPKYSELIVTLFNGELKTKFVQDTIKRGNILLNVLPGMKTINTKKLKYICEKWGIIISPIKFNWPDADGNLREVTTAQDAVIGSKYVIRLCKEAVEMSAGIASVSHHGTPIRPHQSKKHSSLMKQTPVRWGEDEINIITMAVPVHEVLRLQQLTSKSIAGTNIMIEEIVKSPHPTNIDRFSITNAELSQRDTIAGLFEHLNTICGISVSDTTMTKEEYAKMMSLPDVEIMSRSKRRRSRK